MKRTFLTILVLIIVLLGGAFAYWYFFFNGPGGKVTPVVTGNTGTSGFHPFGNVPTGNTGNNQATTTNTNTNVNNPLPVTTGNSGKIPSLRLLSNTPVGGYGDTSKASTTIVRFIDRGKGDVYEVAENGRAVATLSNTLLPRITQSVWNKNLTAFIGSMIKETATSPTVVYAELKAQTTTTNTTAAKAANTQGSNPDTASSLTLTPFVLKGKNLPANMIDYAVSPKGDKVFMLVNESGNGVGYTANFDGTSVTKIFSTPITQINVEWPEDNTIAITTKGTASQGGFLYFVSPKTGIWKKILGPVTGLSAKVSHDAKYVFVSVTNTNGVVQTNIVKVSDNSAVDGVIVTLADKCAWGNFNKNVIYCAVPTQLPSAMYPDAWYAGTVSFTDKIWEMNAATGEIHLVSSIVDQSDRVVDAFNLGVSPKDDYLFFMNKNDLSLWSLDLVATQ